VKLSGEKKTEIALREARDATEAISSQDHLTKLWNRREFDRVLTRQWLSGLQTVKPLSLIICNIDLFRSYNEYYGNLAGDQYLIKIARTISHIVKRPQDLVARTSGEEFSILFSDTTEESALDIAESIRQAVHELTILHAGAPVERVVTASFGVATSVPSVADIERELIEIAGLALTRARRIGGNCGWRILRFCFSSSVIAVARVMLQYAPTAVDAFAAARPIRVSR
jgi:diguanylate cyclase (GGDEF)-like protein